MHNNNMCMHMCMQHVHAHVQHAHVHVHVQHAHAKAKAVVLLKPYFTALLVNFRNYRIKLKAVGRPPPAPGEGASPSAVKRVQFEAADH